jgi:hypothetical protein
MARFSMGKRFAAFVMLGCAAALLVGLVARWPASGHPDDTVVAEVDGEAVRLDEFALVMLQERAEIYNDFRAKYGAEDGTAFWDSRFGDEVPLDKLERDALQRIVEIKVEQRMAREHGLLADAGFAAFREELAAENERRRQTVEAGGIIYGPKRYEAGAYYEIRQARLREELKRAMADQLKPDEEEVRHYYESNRQPFVKKGSTDVYSLDEVRAGIVKQLLDLKFERLVQERIDRAVVVVHEEARPAIRQAVLRGR